MKTSRLPSSFKPAQSRRMSAMLRRLATRRLSHALALSALLGVGGHAAQAASLTWDSTGLNAAAPLNGSGTWDTTNARWSDGGSPAADQIWNNAGNDIAVFGGGTSTGSAGTVTLGAPITVGGLTFNIAGYAINLGANTLTFGGTTPGIATTTGTTYISAGAGGTIATGGLNIVKSGTGSLELNSMASGGAMTFTGGGTLEVQAGQLNRYSVKQFCSHRCSTSLDRNSTTSCGILGRIFIPRNI